MHVISLLKLNATSAMEITYFFKYYKENISLVL